jgi:hypothetical protein
MNATTQIKIDKPQGLCWECNYSLQGLATPRCPECGRPFDPDDPATMNMDTHVGPLARWLMSPPGWPTFILVALATLLSLWAAATPMPAGHIVLVTKGLQNWFERTSPLSFISSISLPEIRILWAALAWLVVLLVWIPRRVLRGITVMKVSSTRAATFAYWRRWLVPLLVLGGTILVCRTPAPVYLGFWLSKPALQRLEQRQQQGHRGPATETSVGIYPYRDVFAGSGYRDEDPNVIHLSQWGGFLHSPDRNPKDDDRAWHYFKLRYMGAGWYSFERRLD